MKISSYLDSMNASSEQVMSNKESVAQAEKVVKLHQSDMM
jgi:hypothetical protein